MSEEQKHYGKKLESSADHAKKALDAATEATRAVGDTVRKQAQSAYDAGKEHITAAAKDLSDAAAGGYDDLRSQARAKADEYRGRAQSAWDDASSCAHTYQDQTEDYIRGNPLQAIGIALGVGFLLGIIFRR